MLWPKPQHHHVISLPPDQRAQTGIKDLCASYQEQHQDGQWESPVSAEFHLCESQQRPQPPVQELSPCHKKGTARCWEVFAAQQQLGVRRNQYVLQWRETEPSSGPVPSWHTGIWNMGQEQSILLITVCLVQWKTCNVGFTSWIPNCLAIFPSTFQIYCSMRAWFSL